jgi:N-acyl-D-aspartate/D-glutamate deacylase
MPDKPAKREVLRMQHKILIRGGTVVDGTGAPAYAADVRVCDGLIAEIGSKLEAGPRERVVDAAGCYVAPGFIETHNHFDAPMWWMPTLEPMPGYGVTTSINGNCGFSAAPISADPEVRMEMVKIFSFFEDIPIEPFVEVLPWDWHKWSEYRRSIETRLKMPINFAAFTGHIPIRLAVMGMEAWDRAATPEEIGRMCALLDDALAAGALGLSSNLHDHDSRDRPVPSLKADDAEFAALLDVLAKYPGATFQVIVDTFMRMTAVTSIERMAAMCATRRVRLQWLGAATYEFQDKMGIRAPIQAMHERFKAEGRDFFTAFSHVPAASSISFLSSLVFAQSNNYVWHDVILARTEAEKLALLEDPAWRERARASWEKTWPQSSLSRPADVYLVESESGYGPVGVALADYMAEAGIAHPSDALAEWLLNNGFRSIVSVKPWAKSRQLCLDLFRDPYALGNVDDAGAHGQMLCGIGDHIHFLTEFVRESGDLTIEQGIHCLTGKLAGFFGLNDRGTLKAGKRADIVVFDLNKIERRPVEKVYDVPDGEGGRTWRYSRAPAPVALTLVNGVPTFDRGRFTGAFPGRVVGPVAEPLALAAE